MNEYLLSTEVYGDLYLTDTDRPDSTDCIYGYSSHHSIFISFSFYKTFLISLNRTSALATINMVKWLVKRDISHTFPVYLKGLSRDRLQIKMDDASNILLTLDS